MPRPDRVNPDLGAELAAVAAYESARGEGGSGSIPRAVRRSAVKELLNRLALQAPGNSVELRVPPDGVTQMIAGPRHRRGMPSATIEMSPETLVGLCVGRLTWEAEIKSGTVQASVKRADLSDLLPLSLGGNARAEEDGA
jgi:hypothetical protein